MNVRVKICGLKDPESMRVASEAGADYLGVVFAASPRQVDPDQLETWLEDARGDAEVVGVFLDQPAAFVEECVLRFDLDFVQLHGDEREAEFKNLPVRLIEASLAADGMLPGPRFPGRAWARLLDSGAGSGQPFDWNLAIPLARAERIFLAGGLTPDSVGEAIRRVAPFAVDVSSGVEREGTPGEKDADRIRAFIEKARGGVKK